MKHLYDYITEKAIGDLGISFEEFKDCVEYGGSTMPVFQKFHEKFGESWYPKHKVFVHYLDEILSQMSKMGVEIDDNILRFIYDKFCNTPESVLNKLMGNGANASVYDLGDKVVKVFFNGKIRSDNRRFYEYCLKHDFKYFPKVFRVGKGYAIMEKLKVETLKIRKYFDAIDKVEGDKTLYWHLKEGTLDWSKLSKDEAEALHWLEGVGQELWKNKILDEGDYGDLSFYNLGERKDGTIVYFDI